MSSRRTAPAALALFASLLLAAVAPASPARAAEVAMLRVIESSTLETPALLARSPAVAPVRIDFAAFEERRLDLPLPDGQVLRVERTDVERRGRRDYAWRGRVAGAGGEADGHVTLTVQGDRVLGRIDTAGAVWQIVHEAGRHWIAQAVEPDTPFCGTDGTSEVPRLVRSAQEGLESAAAPAAAFSRLRLVVVFTRAAAAGNANKLIQEIQHAVDTGNSSMANSGIQARLELVQTREVNYAETPDEPIKDLTWLYEDPAMVALRRRAQAQLISMITLRSSVCGIGNLMDRSEYEGRSPALGVSLVKRSCLDQLTLMHEIGHNLGAHHDPANAGSPSQGLFPYAFGHFVPGAFRTVMSYPNECLGDCPRVQHFSNPNVSFAGQPTGISGQRDNAQVLEATRVRYASGVTTGPSPVCRPGADRLCLVKKRFQVDVEWQNQFNNTSGVGRAVPRTDAAGFFSFGDPSNLELMVKMLDFGDTVKVFWGQLTNLRYRLLITDLKTGQTKSYTNTPGDCGGIDQGAFPGGADAQASLKSGLSGIFGQATASCRPGPQQLCLDNRFLVSVDWRNPGNGTAGQGGAVTLSKVTGAFHFGQASNLELMAKVITQGDRIDFFWGALSDLEYTITVNDTQTGAVKTYSNPAGKYCGGLQVDAF